VTTDFARSQMYLLLGEHTFTLGIWEVLLLAGLALVILLFLAARKGAILNATRQWIAGWRNPNAAVLLLVVCILIYSVAMFYSGLFTMINFGTRMFVPMLPLYLLLVGIGLKWLASHLPASTQRMWLKGALALVYVGYAGTNARDLYLPHPPGQEKVLAAEYAEQTPNGQTLRQWVESNIPADSVIAATKGQPTGYLLRRPTLSLVEANFSAVRWDCDEVKLQMKRFGAHYLILYKPTSVFTSDTLLTESQFVATSVTQQPICGFVIAAENPYVRILEIEDMPTTAQN